MSKDKQQLQSWPLISDQTTGGSSTLSLLRRQGTWTQRRGLSCGELWRCRRVVSGRVRGFLGVLWILLHGGYQRAEASSVSHCDDRCCNERFNESERRWKGAVGATGTAEFKSAGKTSQAHVTKWYISIDGVTCCHVENWHHPPHHHWVAQQTCSSCNKRVELWDREENDD